MRQMRRSLVAALVLFTAAISLDRVGIGSGDDTITGYAYVIALAAMVIPVLSPAARRMPVWIPGTMALATLAAAKVVLGDGLIGGVAAHVVATEGAFVTLAGMLGARLGATVARVDDLLATTAFGDSPVLDLEGRVAANEIHAELARGRRHDRPLSVTVITPTPRGLETALERASVEVDRAIKTRYLYGVLSRAVAGQLRRSDLLFEHRPSGRLVVLSPETDAAGLAPLVQRIVDAAAQHGIETAAGTASFPEDGVGFETLVGHAAAEIEDESEPRLRAVEQGGLG